MNRNQTIRMILATIVIVGIISCQKSLLKNISTRSIETIWYSGGDIQRRGLGPEEISPPLKLLWTHKAHSALGQTIVASDSFLAFGTKDGWLTILALQTGKKIREIKIKKQISITSLFDNKRLYVAQRWDTPSLLAFDLETGNTIWKQEKGAITGEPLIIEDRLIAGNDKGDIFALNPKTGENLWNENIKEPVSGYALDSLGTLVVATDNGTLYALSSVNGQVRWKQQLSGSTETNPVLSGDKILIGTREGNFYALSIDNGSLYWQFAGKGGIYLTGATDQAFIYFGTTQGILYCLDIDTGKEKWHFETNSVIGTSPLISGKWIYFGTLDKILYGISADTGKELWQFKTKGRIRTSPLVQNGMIIMASEDRYVYGFRGEK